MSDKGKYWRTGCLVMMLVTVVAWALIAWGVVTWLGKPVVKPDSRTACERGNPPWAIAERCR